MAEALQLVDDTSVFQRALGDIHTDSDTGKLVNQAQVCMCSSMGVWVYGCMYVYYSILYYYEQSAVLLKEKISYIEQYS